MCIKKLIIDTNLLLLLVIGGVDQGRYIGRSSRLNKFSERDYRIVLEYISDFQVFITPYIAAEVSNLIDLKGEAAQKAFEVARVFFGVFEQIDSVIKDDCSGVEFQRFGITDSSLVRLVKDYLVLTDDNRLTVPLYAECGENVIPYDFIKNLVS
ncbi:hypothetical protein RAL92_21810 [Metapseudomonas otitidis]|uniref:hypothetical protein n=1 Tax=Metapseudomonas otitidis TaxID=319939 RepID=UPI0032168CDE